MGFVSEELNETEKRSIQQNKVSNMAVVYGKEASMWKVSIYTANTHAYLYANVLQCIHISVHTYIQWIYAPLLKCEKLNQVK